MLICLLTLPTMNAILDLTHWGRVMHICVSELTIIGSDNGLSPGRRQAIIWTNAGILLIGPLATNFSEIVIRIQTFSFTKLYLKTSSAKRRLFCLGLNELNIILSYYAATGSSSSSVCCGSSQCAVLMEDSVSYMYLICILLYYAGIILLSTDGLCPYLTAHSALDSSLWTRICHIQTYTSSLSTAVNFITTNVLP